MIYDRRNVPLLGRRGDDIHILANNSWIKDSNQSLVKTNLLILKCRLGERVRSSHRPLPVSNWQSLLPHHQVDLDASSTKKCLVIKANVSEISHGKRVHRIHWRRAHQIGLLLIQPDIRNKEAITSLLDANNN